jgi:hypothetical protein
LGYYDLKPPPDRIAQPLPANSEITIADIPNIPETTSSLISGESLGLNGFIVDRQVNINGENVTEKPTVNVSGYLVAIEKQPDNSYLFAVELPYLDSPKDIISRSKVSTNPDIKNGDMQTVNVGGVIVWLKLFNGQTPNDFPFKTTVTWTEGKLNIGHGLAANQPSGTGEDTLIKYIKVGDIISAHVNLTVDINDPSISDSIDHYAKLNGKDPNNLRGELTTITNNNMNTVKKMINDARNGNSIPLINQINSKTYVLTPDLITFVPQTNK